jgi:hypothetical protein
MECGSDQGRENPCRNEGTKSNPAERVRHMAWLSGWAITARHHVIQAQDWALQTWDDRDPCSVLGGHRSDPACLGSLTSTNHAAVPPLPSLCGMVHGADSGRMQVLAPAVAVSAALQRYQPRQARPRVMRRGPRLGRGGLVCAWVGGARVVDELDALAKRTQQRVDRHFIAIPLRDRDPG